MLSAAGGRGRAQRQAGGGDGGSANLQSKADRLFGDGQALRQPGRPSALPGSPCK